MLIILVGLAIAAVLIYRYYESDRHYWTRRGIPGPQATFFWGNFREIIKPEHPRALVFNEWAQQYGKIYGISEGRRKALVISDFKMVEEILTKKFDCFQGRMKFPLRSSKQGPKTNIIDAHGAHWKRLRALGSPAFSKNSLKKILATVEHSSRLMLEHLEKREDSVNIMAFYQEYTIDIISKLALGRKDVKMFENPFRELANKVFTATLAHPVHIVPSLFPFLLAPWLFVVEKVGSLLGAPYRRLLEDLRKVVATRKKERAAGRPSSFDFIDMFLDAEVNQSDISYEGDRKEAISRQLGFEEVAQLCLIFVLAGYETTANSLSYVTHFLANHPEVQERMREEIEAICPDEDISFEQLSELKYTESVVKESLRHYPLGSFVVARECTRSTQVGDFFIEKGTALYTNTWAIHMNEELWGPDVREFRPERWLDGSLTAPRAAFQGFGEGPRMCLGMRLAFMEEKVALTHLLRRFSIRPTEKTNPIKLMGCFTVYPQHVTVRVQRR